MQHHALLVDEHGEREDAAIDWAYCSEPKPQGELNDVATGCFVLTADYLSPLGVGLGVKGTLPANACRQFGPDVPESKPGEPAGRPADPDTTGGYYQPIRLILPNGGAYLLAAGETRLTCGLSGATSEALLAFKSAYRSNENPVIEGVALLGTGDQALAPDDGSAAPLAVAAGKAVRLRVSWPDCPAKASCGDGICSPGEDAASCAADCKAPHGCGGAERFVYYDPGSQALSPRREAMAVSWFSTAGSFASDRTGQDEAAARRNADNTWTAPARAGEVVLWVVLRDSRGGVTWKRYRLAVR
jgi:hypothetical protein